VDRSGKEKEERIMDKVGRCPICGGKTSVKAVDVTENVEKRLVLIRKVQAEVCLQCGERMYSEGTMRKLDSLLQRVREGSAKPKKETKVEVYALTQ